MLIVIGIIAVIVAFSATSYSTAQKKARDAKRKTDLKSAQNCLEQYYSYNNNYKYPIVANGTLSSSLNCGTTTLSNVQDPLNATINGVSYLYTVTDSDANGTKYTIRACLEAVGTGSSIFTVSNQQ